MGCRQTKPGYSCESGHWRAKMGEKFSSRGYPMVQWIQSGDRLVDYHLMTTYNIKILLDGASGVGKTAILKRINQELKPSTLDDDELDEPEDLEDKFKVNTDTLLSFFEFGTKRAGKNRDVHFACSLSAFAVDLNDISSLNYVKNALDFLIQSNSIRQGWGRKTFKFLLVGTKRDIASEGASLEAQRFAVDNNMAYAEISSKTDNNISHLFVEIANEIVDEIGPMYSRIESL